MTFVRDEEIISKSVHDVIILNFNPSLPFLPN